MLTELVDKQFLTVFLIIGFAMKLWSKRGATDVSLRYYWLTVISTAALIAADSLEDWTELNPDLRFLRILFSVIGYCMRPTAALSICLIIFPKKRRPFWLWIPNILNALIYCTAFFTKDIAFGYHEDYSFNRGPLGYTVFVVSFLYILLSLILAWQRFRDKDRRRERYVLYLCALACVAAAFIDMRADRGCLNSTIMISAIFLYIFLRSIDLNRDPLTKLLNRMSFFEDCNRLGATISAVGSADMNGLKHLNDAVGHEAGDDALREIGKILNSFSNKHILAYRTGGDEFALLFLRESEEGVKQIMASIEEQVKAKGYTVSTGYALRGGAYASVQDLIRWSDEKMYANKAEFYSQNSHDRRKRP